MASFGEMDDIFHDFATGLTDVSIEDSGGGPVPYMPRADEVTITGPHVILDDPEPFGVTRLQVVVGQGKTACLEYDLEGELLSSWRPGRPADGGGSWSHELPEFLEGEAVFVVTATMDGAHFTARATEVVEDPEDCEEEEEEAADACLTSLCGPSGYYQLCFLGHCLDIPTPGRSP